MFESIVVSLDAKNALDFPRSPSSTEKSFTLKMPESKILNFGFYPFISHLSPSHLNMTGTLSNPPAT